MARPLDPDTLLDVRLSAMCSRARYTTEPDVVVAELRHVAGVRVDVLARVAGSWVGYYGDQHTRHLCDALLTVDGAAQYVADGVRRRGAPSHGAPMVKP